MTVWTDRFDAAEVAWLIVSAAVTLLLVWPGYIVLYSGLPDSREMTGRSGRWLSLLAVLSLVWVLWVYSLAFAPSYGTVPEPGEAPPVPSTIEELLAASEAIEDTTEEQGRGGFIGGGEYRLLRGLTPRAGHPDPIFRARRDTMQVPQIVLVMLHLAVFVAATAPLAVLLSNSLAWRGILAFVVLWGTVVYAPLVHWLWGDGWLREFGALDASGGLVHIAIGFSALMCGILLPTSRRLPSRPDAGSTTLGAALVWIGAILLYSALTLKADGRAAAAGLNTHLAAAGGVIGWIVTALATGSRAIRPSLGLGAVAALAAIAPGCSLILPQSSLIVGLVSGAIACFAYSSWCASTLQSGRALFALHGLSGVLGMLLTGVFATSSMAGLDRHQRAIDGLVGGDTMRVAQQGAAIAAAAALALLGTALVLTIARFACGQIPVDATASPDASLLETHEPRSD